MWVVQLWSKLEKLAWQIMLTVAGGIWASYNIFCLFFGADFHTLQGCCACLVTLIKHLAEGYAQASTGTLRNNGTKAHSVGTSGNHTVMMSAHYGPWGLDITASRALLRWSIRIPICGCYRVVSKQRLKCIKKRKGTVMLCAMGAGQVCVGRGQGMAKKN